MRVPEIEQTEMERLFTMARLPITAPGEAKGKARSLLSDVQKKFGVVPNMTCVMANSPATLDAELQSNSALEGGAFDAR